MLFKFLFFMCLLFKTCDLNSEFGSISYFNVVGKLGNILIFPKFNSTSVKLWQWSKVKKSDNKTQTIYADSIILPFFFEKMFCSNAVCDMLSIKRFSMSDIGYYSSWYASNEHHTANKGYYNVVSYIGCIELNCNQNCNYFKHQNLLSLKE